VTAGGVRPFLSRAAARALGAGAEWEYSLYEGESTLDGPNGCGFEEFAASNNGEYFLLPIVAGCDASVTPTPMPSPVPTASSKGPGPTMAEPAVTRFVGPNDVLSSRVWRRPVR
jgi:hypothetical protein